MPIAPQVAAPEKELRFTRSGQALVFWLATIALVAAAFIILVSASGRDTDLHLIHPLWALLPAVLAWGTTRVAIRLTRHAYLILTPLGVEVFPFFRPAEGMRMVSWGEIHQVEFDATVRHVTLHFNPERTSGIHLSLRPIRESLRPLLVEALVRRVRTSSESRSGS